VTFARRDGGKPQKTSSHNSRCSGQDLSTSWNTPMPTCLMWNLLMLQLYLWLLSPPDTIHWNSNIMKMTIRDISQCSERISIAKTTLGIFIVDTVHVTITTLWVSWLFLNYILPKFLGVKPMSNNHNNTVTGIPIARQRLGKHIPARHMRATGGRPLLGNRQ
jgi:hypothetical protein